MRGEENRRRLYVPGYAAKATEPHCPGKDWDPIRITARVYRNYRTADGFAAGASLRQEKTYLSPRKFALNTTFRIIAGRGSRGAAS